MCAPDLGPGGFEQGSIMKRVSYNPPNHAHFLTFSCYRKLKLLTSDDVCGLLTEAWNEARRRGNFDIWAYVIMPEHTHLLIYPRNENYEMSKMLRRLKEQFGHKVVDHWKDISTHLLDLIKVRRGSRLIHRFWQEGGGYDRNLYNWDGIGRAIDYIEWNPVRRGLVTDPLEWEGSSARSRAGARDVPLVVDEIRFTYRY